MKFVRKLTKRSSHSYSIIIPKELVEKFGWREKQKISVEEKDRKRIELKDWKKR